MKKILLPVCGLLFFAGTQLNAQASVRCASHEYMQEAVAADPSLNAVIAQNEQDYQNFSQQHPNGYTNRSVAVIPVIFHVVYKVSSQNLSTSRLQEQIDVLNADYRKNNSDASLVPSAWQGVTADCEIEFCLAKQDPNGNWTDGIERTQTTVSSFGMTGDPVKFAASGGADAWDRNKYLNIWVCNLSGGLLGYSTFPGGAANKDGVVLLYTAVGVTGAGAPYNKGRTATHEIGHWLNLRHIWGDDTDANGVCSASADGAGRCTGSDQVSDTPNQCDCHYGTFPAGNVQTDDCTTSAPGTMWMNFMDYTDDAAMYMFTAGQKTRIWAALNGSRSPILSSNACQITGITEFLLKSSLTISPNPSSGNFMLDFKGANVSNIDVSVYNVLGQTVFVRHYDALNENQVQLDLSANTPGVYFIEVKNQHEKITRKVVIN